MAVRRRITEYLSIDLETEMWCCHECGQELISARENYKKGCLVYDRDPQEIHQKHVSEGEYFLASDSRWMRLLEFCCPHCGTMIEVESLPPGHPITHDIEVDIEVLKRKGLGT